MFPVSPWFLGARASARAFDLERSRPSAIVNSARYNGYRNSYTQRGHMLSSNVAIDLLHRTVRQVTDMNRSSPTGDSPMPPDNSPIDNATNDDEPQPPSLDDDNDDRFYYVERLLNKRTHLLDLSHGVYMYNTTDVGHRADCNSFVANCPFVFEGPHKPVRLCLAASSILLAMAENGYSIPHNNESSHDRRNPFNERKPEIDLTSCDTYVACKYCKSRLVNVHMLVLVLGRRYELLYTLMQRNLPLMSRGTLSVVALHALFNEHTNLPTRSKFARLLRKTHKSNCIYLDKLFNQELLLDPMSANRMLNTMLRTKCETCLVSLIEHDIRCNLQLDDILADSDDAIAAHDGREASSAIVVDDDEATRGVDDSSDETTTARDSVEEMLACKCCMTKRARVNVPCGHAFQCNDCEKLLRRGNNSVFKNPPCSVCRSPVLVTVDLFT